MIFFKSQRGSSLLCTGTIVVRCACGCRNEACALERPDDFLRPRAGQLRQHTYAMMGVLTVMPRDTGFLLSTSSGISSPCAISVSR